MKPLQLFGSLFWVITEFAACIMGLTFCPLGYNYPLSCPREFDPPSYTRCCRSGHYAACCEDRANYVCASTRTGKYSGFNKDPGPDDYALFCPQPAQPDNYQSCCWRNGVPSCCDTRLLGGIMGGVFGTLALVGIIIMIVCCVKVKKGDWVCVKVRPGKTVMMTRAKLEMYQTQRNMRMQQRHQLQMIGATPYGHSNPNYEHTYPQQQQQQQQQQGPKHSESGMPSSGTPQGQYWDPNAEATKF